MRESQVLALADAVGKPEWIPDSQIARAGSSTSRATTGNPVKLRDSHVIG